MNKGTLTRKINEKVDKITNSIYELRDLLDDTENGDLSQMGNDLADAMIEFISDNDIVTSSDILEYIEEYYGKGK
jgi:flagellin-specific chaperone FliS